MNQVITLVTGGAGFIGFHLCRRLLDEGDAVICLDDMSTGTQEHVDRLAVHRNLRFIRHDVTRPINLHVHRIFNLACPASPAAYEADPIKTTLTNVLGTRNMLELARSNGARFVQASTSEVYGDPEVHPQPEGYRGNVSTTGPRSCYDEGKRCAESLVFDYERVHRLNVRVARIFNTYGPGMREDDGRVVSNFVVQALRGRDLTVYGDGSNTRSMCYVDDMVEGLARLMKADSPVAGPINLGNPREISILDLARMVSTMVGSASTIVHLPAVVDDPRVRCPDITRAKAKLDWEPRIALEEGLRRTIGFFAERLVVQSPSAGPDRGRGSLGVVEDSAASLC
ncbi:UDP-glucuronic acid decarboxylase family protein [Mesorhizobium erdmanii]|uniref:UDP-glucuronate decarboxylase n=1 Tax=Mesorhizobium erdmanii TaxID=1777866 RepID=A0A6M7UDU9_9HYPH|nr:MULTISPECIES: UDP-glucuronic acid decarboxylase family protein [Mesorhizobium]OBQ73592.1 NAD-dependent dehydratase [Mesorhizobium loti]QKC76019.1 SDR family oxidoreductase [Mesorhizobium erdmanii]